MAVRHQGANKALESALAEYDAELKALQVRYEQYFLGIERREPSQERDALRKGVMALKRENIRNTALKFRLNSLWNKLLSYERMWNRTVKEIEEGRYRRDVFKAKMRGYDVGGVSKSGAKKAIALPTEPGADSLSQDEDEQHNGRGAPRGRDASRPAAASPSSKDKLSSDRVDRLYKAFVMAKKKCKEDVSGLSRDGLERSLKKQLPSLQKKHKGKNVDFKVVIRGGKAVLKAVPK